jgi:hypothetical protein
MALDWSFPSQPNEACDSLLADLSEPSSLLDASCLSPFGQFEDPFTFTNDSIAYPDSIFPDPSLYEHGQWENCMCEFGSVDGSCKKHNDTSLNDTPFQESLTSDLLKDNIHALEAVPPANTNSPYLNSATSITTGPESRPAAKKQKSAASHRSQRTVISKEAKRILEAQFDVNPYPSSEELGLLSKRIGLSPKSVTTWYCNARSRKGKLKRELIHTLSTVSSFRFGSMFPSNEDCPIYELTIVRRTRPYTTHCSSSAKVHQEWRA